MTDRDKRIGELSNLLAITFVEKMKPNGIKYEDIAESIDDEGYKKVSEGDIIIHKDPTKRTEEEIEWLVNHNREVRGAVLMDLYKELSLISIDRESFYGNIESISVDDVKDIIKEKFGVEIKMNNSE